jgi:hypothetical protein
MRSLGSVALRIRMFMATGSLGPAIPPSSISCTVTTVIELVTTGPSRSVAHRLLSGMRIRNAVDLSIRLSHLLNRERPIFSRMTSFDHPEVLEEGMVFALETYWPAKDGWSAARIEEEVVVTATGCEVITKFPAEELLVAGKR